jgi:hypothetical protein
MSTIKLASSIRHEFVYREKPVWGGGHNIVCKNCGLVEAFSRDKDPEYLAEINADFVNTGVCTPP